MGSEQTLSYISDVCVFDKSVCESTKPDNGSVLRVIRGPIAEWESLNRNKRKYSEKLWDNVLASPYVVEQLKYKTLYGEANHPTDRYEVDFSRVSHSIVEMWKVPATSQIYGTVYILDTPLGRIINTLYEAGGVIGYSSRAGGVLTKRKDYTEVDEKSYNFITFDAVPFPSVESARPETLNEGVMIEKVVLSEECHSNLIRIINESSTKDKEVIKDLIYSLQSYDLSEEVSLLEGVIPKNGLKENTSIDETTKFLLKESSSQIDTLRAEKSSLKASVDNLIGENKELRNNLDSSLRKISNLVNESKDSEDIKQVLEKRYANTISELKSRVSELVSESADMEMELDRYKDIQEAVKALQIENEILQKENEFNEKALTEGVTISRVNYSKEVEEVCEELSHAVVEINALHESVEALNMEKQTLIKEFAEKNKRVSELEDQVQDMSIRLNESRERKSTVSEELESSNQSLVVENTSIKNELREIKSSIRNKESKVDTLKKELVSVISSQYGLAVEDVMRELPVGFGKSDVFCVCEALHNKAPKKPEIESIIESNTEKVSHKDDESKSVNKSLIGLGFGTNRRGLSPTK